MARASPALPSKLLWAACVFSLLTSGLASDSRICIIGAGIGGSALAFFLEEKNVTGRHEVVVIERDSRVGGRMLLADVDGEFFEAGASIIHERNTHMANFAKVLGLGSKFLTGLDFGIWDGQKFRLTQLQEHSLPWPLAVLRNILVMTWRYGTWRLHALKDFTERMFEKWVLMYHEDVAPYLSPDDMLKRVGLLSMTQASLNDSLRSEGLSETLIDELVTAVVRIQYGQNSSISALAGAVGLFGTGRSLWQVPGGNHRVAEGLLQKSGARLLLNHTVAAVIREEASGYLLRLDGGGELPCGVVAVAAPLVESGIQVPTLGLPPQRPYHHTHVTFVRGELNQSYFGYKEGSTLPGLVATVESEAIPFSSISLQGEIFSAARNPVYKIFSRQYLTNEVIKSLFTSHTTVVRFDWAAYPSYRQPHSFAPFLLDDHHLYYLNTFEDAASAMEAAAVAARNVARLIQEGLDGGAPRETEVIPEEAEAVAHEEL